MKKEVILVPKDKCPLNVLREMGERIRNSWIFLHDDVVSKLETTSNYIEEKGYQELVWSATEKYSQTTLDIEIVGTWHKVYRIIAEGIAFEYEAQDPEDIYFLKMDE